MTTPRAVLEYCKDQSDQTESIVYRYLLLSTRLDMIKNKVLGGQDGTALLEHLSAHVLKQYLGERAKSFVFGTAESGNFGNRIRQLCTNLGEGVGFKPLDGDTRVTANDDKLDSVAWIPFVDSSPGQLIVFGQCKTGTNWNELTTQLQPAAFAKRWLVEPFIVDPVRAFCVSEALDRSKWKSRGTSAGIVFDRCRLVDYCNGVDTGGIAKWTDAAKKSFSVVSISRGAAKKKKVRKKPRNGTKRKKK